MNTRRQTSGQKQNGGGEVADNELCFSPARRMEEEEVTDADVTINFSSLDVAVDELVCFSPARRIKRGLFNSPSMNTRSCLAAQKRKGPDKEEVAGASDDDHSDREEVTTNFSFPDRKRVKKMSDEELLVILSEGTTRLPSCISACDCLVILSDVNVRQCVAQYLLQFVRKSKYDQDSIILEWYKYTIAARIGHRQLWFCLPYDATWNADIDCLRVLREHRLCTQGMHLLLGIRYRRYATIRAAASVGVMPRHRGAG